MMSKIELPKINQRKKQSRIMCNELEGKILQVISELETEYNYEFESFEVDSVLLAMVQNNHRLYLKEKFGADAD